MALKRNTNLRVKLPPHRHCYPTRWNLARHASSSSSQAQSIEDKAEDQVLVAGKRRKVERDTSCLPRDILFNILLLVSVDVLHEVVKYVCKQWYDNVSDPLFVRTHQQLSSIGLLIQDPKKPHQMYYIEGDSAKSKVTEIQLPLPAILYGSFNGLILLHDKTNPEMFHVMNPVTKQSISLPPFVGLKVLFGSTGFVVDSSGHYKVVHVTAKVRSYTVVKVQMRVITVGIDKAWRCIDLQHIPMNSVMKNTLLIRPWYIAGFLYWFSSLLIGFALDVETQTIYQFSRPKDFVKGRWPSYFLNMGTSLGLMKFGGDICRLWKLTDIKSGEWTQLAGINLGEVVRRVDKAFYPSRSIVFIPFRFIDGDIWYYRRVDEEFAVVRYNLISESFVFFRIKNVYDRIVLHPYVQTLLSPKNC